MKKTLLALAAGASLWASHVRATPIPTDGSWHSFTFHGEGEPFAYEPFTFTLDTTALLTVTDLYLSGDRLAIYNNGVLLGLTSMPQGGIDDYVGSYDMALLDPRWSSASWQIGPGSYSITGTAVLSPWGVGAGGIRVITGAVPEADAALAFGLGAGVIGLVLRRWSARAEG
ncbi:hypothetical protein [Derxia gummosa]|uniref:PEP-CTERM sorting domain-containing protein n=1 Tax=Derxia gummosa DSM 723 TaxID=1121388 RepID=A0A8B6X611_9BURK|nr:hypothetical protein [Derxia gummosa]